MEREDFEDQTLEAQILARLEEPSTPLTREDLRKIILGEPGERVLEAGAEVSTFLYHHPEITARLPRQYRLVVLLLDDLEALAWALEGAQGSGEAPVVYALVREGEVQGLLTPDGVVLAP
ncbi:MAG: DUF5647 family protein [Thermus sp.]